MSVAIERSSRFEQHECRFKNNGLFTVIHKIMLLRILILHTHRTAVHQINDRSGMRIRISAVMIRKRHTQCPIVRGCDTRIDHFIGQCGNLHIRTGFYQPRLQSAHINQTAYLTRVAEYIPVATEAYHAVCHIVVEYSRKRLSTTVNHLAALVQLEVQHVALIYKCVRQSVRILLRQIRSKAVQLGDLSFYVIDDGVGNRVRRINRLHILRGRYDGIVENESVRTYFDEHLSRIIIY